MHTSARIVAAALLGVSACLATVASAQTVGPYTVSFELPSCLAPIVTGTSPNFVVTCSTGLHCIAQGPSGPQTPGTAVALTAACSPAATSISWQASRECTPPSPGSTTAANETAGPKSCVYTAVASAGTLTGLANVSVQWGSGTAGAPANCNVAAFQSNQVPVPLAGLGSGGGAINLQGSCTGTVTSWTWRKSWSSNNQLAWSALQNPSDSLSANTGSTAVTYTYGLTACNGTSCAPEVTRQIPVAAATGGGGSGFCANYGTVVETTLTQVGTAYSAQYGGLVSDGVFVVAFTIPSGAAATNSYAMDVSEYQDGQVSRHVSLSTEKCDFRLAEPPNGALEHGAGVTAGVTFGGPSGANTPRLEAGRTYYLNVRNWDFLGNRVSCTAPTCNVIVSYSQR